MPISWEERDNLVPFLVSRLTLLRGTRVRPEHPEKWGAAEARCSRGGRFHATERGLGHARASQRAARVDAAGSSLLARDAARHLRRGAARGVGLAAHAAAVARAEARATERV